MAVVNFVMNYYIWFLAGIIIILLAIIGAYADKTNFGQGKKNNEDKKDDAINSNLKNKKLSEVVENNDQHLQSSSDNKEVVPSEPSSNINDSNNISSMDETNKLNNGIEVKNTIENNGNGENNNINQDVNQKNTRIEDITIESLNLEEKLNKLNSEINDILPEKELIDFSLLEDVNDMEIDTGHEKLFDKNDDFEIEDLKLPEIKKPKKETQDVWNE